MVKSIESKAEFDALVSIIRSFNLFPAPSPTKASLFAQIAGDKPVVVDFSTSLSSDAAVTLHLTDITIVLAATWCGPCKMISPHFEKMEAAFENVVFVKVDVDDQAVRSRS